MQLTWRAHKGFSWASETLKIRVCLRGASEARIEVMEGKGGADVGSRYAFRRFYGAITSLPLQPVVQSCPLQAPPLATMTASSGPKAARHWPAIHADVVVQPHSERTKSHWKRNSDQPNLENDKLTTLVLSSQACASPETSSSFLLVRL